MSGAEATTALPHVVIGAGPSGLCAVRRLKERDIAVIGLEAHSDVGGLWDIDSATSTMYQSAHLISSKRMTELTDFPMADDVAEYPSHDQLKHYFRDFARHFDLYPHYQFNSWVERVEPQGEHWLVHYQQQGEAKQLLAAGVIIANGTLHQPKRAQFNGEFDGMLMHSSSYRSADIFADKRVLIVGCGNSGCDIAVDAVHRARSVDMVVRRGYYFLPKFIAGRPTDTLGGKIKLPTRLKQWLDGTLVRLISGPPSRYGLPEPDYRMYESHPVVNSLFLHHIGHGDIKVRPSVDVLTPTGARFVDGSSGDYDIILEATGYQLHYPFIDQALLNWKGFAPQLYLNIFNPQQPKLFMLGMVEAAGLGWQGRDDQAQLVAEVIAAQRHRPAQAEAFFSQVRQQAVQRINGGIRYLELERMAFYVHKAEYLKAVQQQTRVLRQGAD